MMKSMYQFEISSTDVDSLEVEKPRLTTEFMTKYEYTRLVTKRAEELRKGSPPMLDVGDCIDVIEIARREISARIIPFCIIRKLPTGQKEIWKIKDMHIRDH